MSVNDNALASVENVADYLNIDLNMDLPIIERLINVHSSSLEVLLGRRLKGRTYTNLRLNGNGLNWLLWPEYPLTGISSLVVEDSSQQTIETIDVTLTNKKILIDREIGKVILMETVFTTGTNNILTTCVAGLDPTNTQDLMILDLLEHAVVLMIQHSYTNKGLVDQLLKSEKIGDYSYSRSSSESFSGLPSSMQSQLLELKRV
jgi:hypothetical protein